MWKFLQSAWTKFRGRLEQRENNFHHTEASYSVSIDDKSIVVRQPSGVIESIEIKHIRKIYVETNDTGPWGMDVRWIVCGREKESEWCSFPQGAKGEEVLLDAFFKLPGFQIRGMNSSDNRRFECWPDPKSPEETPPYKPL